MTRRSKARSTPEESFGSATPSLKTGEEEYSQRATFYFSEDQLLKLEVVMLKLRTEQRLKVGKSEIMRAALDYVLEDYDRNKTKSWLVRRFTGKDST